MPGRTQIRRSIVLLCAAVAATTALAGQAAPVTVTVLEDTQDRIVLHYELGSYTTDTVVIDGRKHALIQLGEESPMKVAGAPALPNVCRSVIVPDDAQMVVRVVASSCAEITDIDLAPSKGFILRTVNPEDVPYTFGKVYQTDAFYPGELATLRRPYIMRDYRGVVVEFNPFQYNPVSRTLCVYHDVTLELVRVGSGQVNVLKYRPDTLSQAFHGVYRRHFLNYGSRVRYDPLDEEGDLLIIAHDAWIGNVQPLADHKNLRGIDTTIVGVSTIPGGNNATSIKAYIQDVYDTSDLAFVLLVGDGSQVDTPYASGGSSDPTYSKLAGSDDYPDIMVGRFSAETPGDVDTQVERTVEYELMPATSQDWFWKGTGIASNQGPGDDGEYDNEHVDNIRFDLLAYGYTHVDQIYDPYGTASQVSEALNNGRGIINYCGHGSTTSWSTTGFSNSHVNALANDNMLPFICSVACVNGQFDGYTCFAEAWLRATHNGEPTGAIAAYMSSVNQSWSPPMAAQDEFVDMYVAETYSCVGTLFYAGSCLMMDEYGSGGVSMFDTWHVFGDPSLRVVMSCTDAGTLALDSTLYACEETMTIQVVDCGLNLDDGVADTAQVLAVSDTEPAGELVTLTELGTDTGQFDGTVALSAADADGVLQVSTADTITVTYDDADDGTGNPAVVTSDAVADCTAPSIWNVQVTDLEPHSATVTFDADETVRGTVQYGLSCDNLTDAASGSYGNPASVGLTGLQDNTTYYFIVFAEDEVGNQVSDDNGGACYSFTTPEIPDFFTEEFGSDNDLDYLSLFFTPDGSVDYYAGCAQDIGSLPTDPNGGTALSISENSYQEVSLGGGETVSLYGASYSSFYVCDNGYITFTGSDTDYSESLADHFDMPRISLLFDNLSVDNDDGFVSWKQEADRAVVTYENVPEYGTNNNNTFQVEMYFNGDIRISYLALDANDGLAGLSEGNGLDPDFYETDLSAMESCGPRPPIAASDSVITQVNIAITVTLNANDDGLPEPPTMDYIIVSLPTNGTLSDPGAGTIDSVPYTLVGGGNLVEYDPAPAYIGPDSFTFKANDGGTPPEGGDSNVATIDIEVSPPVPHPVYDFPLDTDPGWSVEGQWAFGHPTGGGSHNGDPSSGHTGSNVYGYNLNGDYATSMPIYYLTTTAIDCGTLSQVELRFWRWLGVESSNFDHATVEVSNDGSAWTTLWENPLSSISDTSWSQMVFDLSAIADGEPTVYLRWSMGPTDPSVTYPGWNIDDVAIWATVAECPGDLDGDNDVDLADLAELLANYGTTSGAVYEDGDLDGDGDVDLADLAELLSLYGTTC